MAERGYDGATLAAIVKESKVPASSVYHYFGSKTSILLAVMERGSVRFFSSIPTASGRDGSAEDYLTGAVADVARALEEHPDFLRLLVTLAAMPPTREGGPEVSAVVNRVRNVALRQLRAQLALAFDLEPESAAVDRLARFALSMVDGAFVAHEADPAVSLGSLLELLPKALVALAQTLAPPAGAARR